MGILAELRNDILEKDRLKDGVAAPDGNLSLTSVRSETGVGKVEHNGRIGLDPGMPHLVRPLATKPAANMANELLTPSIPDAEAAAAAAYLEKHAFDGFLGKAFEEKPIWKELYENVVDVFFPRKLPPLQLTSTPIPVPDRMKVKANTVAIGIATAVNGIILLLVLYFGARLFIEKVVKPQLASTPIDVGEFKLQGPKGPQAGGGGGGGDHSLIDPIKGRLPKKSPDPIVQPQVQTLDHPKLAIEPTINVQENLKLPDNPTLPTIGVTKSANVQLASNGEGSNGGMGIGKGGGLAGRGLATDMGRASTAMPAVDFTRWAAACRRWWR